MNCPLTRQGMGNVYVVDCYKEKCACWRWIEGEKRCVIRKIAVKDYWCRNCHFRFVPTDWVDAQFELVPMCIRCDSNATEPYKNQETENLKED